MLVFELNSARVEQYLPRETTVEDVRPRLKWTKDLRPMKRPIHVVEQFVRRTVKESLELGNFVWYVIIVRYEHVVKM